MALSGAEYLIAVLVAFPLNRSYTVLAFLLGALWRLPLMMYRSSLLGLGMSRAEIGRASCRERVFNWV